MRWKAILILMVILTATFFLIPSISPNLPSFWETYLPKDKIQLGLDLQGGMHLVLEVEAEKAAEGALERLCQDLEETFIKEGIPITKPEKTQKTQFSFELLDLGLKKKMDKILEENFPTLERMEKGTLIQLTLSPGEVAQIKKNAVDQALETIRNRVDEFGVKEPTIQRQGEDQIVIQLPGIKDPQRAIDLIGKTALLEFKLVDDEHSLDSALKGNIPLGSEISWERYKDRETGEIKRIPYLLKKKTLMTGEVLRGASVKIGEFGEAYVALEFDGRGAKLFDRITQANVSKRLAIILDNNVYSAPVIQERISGGHAQISGRFTDEEARDLAIVLRAGTLPAPVTILENRTIGPSLGQDSIRQGIRSIVIGGMAVVLFMVIYYKVSGLVAVFALILNIILILAALIASGATLTLPGIAGILLTIGMAVDANILIFERIREEQRQGRTPRVSIENGYSRAFSAIFDSNLTTILTALILFYFGTGPIKGFGVTLSIGILASFFTAILVTRLIFDYLLKKRRMKTISI